MIPEWSRVDKKWFARYPRICIVQPMMIINGGCVRPRSSSSRTCIYSRQVPIVVRRQRMSLDLWLYLSSSLSVSLFSLLFLHLCFSLSLFIHISNFPSLSKPFLDARTKYSPYLVFSDPRLVLASLVRNPLDIIHIPICSHTHTPIYIHKIQYVQFV